MQKIKDESEQKKYSFRPSVNAQEQSKMRRSYSAFFSDMITYKSAVLEETEKVISFLTGRDERKKKRQRRSSQLLNS